MLKTYMIRCSWIAYADGRLVLRTLDYLFGWNEVTIGRSDIPDHKGECWVKVELVPPGKGCQDTMRFYAKTYTDAIEQSKIYIRKDVEIVQTNKLEHYLDYLNSKLKK